VGNAVDLNATQGSCVVTAADNECDPKCVVTDHWTDVSACSCHDITTVEILKSVVITGVYNYVYRCRSSAMHQQLTANVAVVWTAIANVLPQDTAPK
jgi:hypothetical protein